MQKIKATALAIAGLAACNALSGCLVMGYSSGGGWWVWPGSIILTGLALLLMLLRNRH